MNPETPPYQFQPQPQYSPPAYQPQTTLQPPKKPSESWRSIFSTIFILIAAPIIAVLLINFVFQSYEVDGPSMETTLSDSDRLIIWKVPRTISRLTGREYIPNRGDIVVFHKGGLYDRSRSENRQLIKRVIGLPGDRVEVMNGGITIYNSDYPDGFQPDKESGYEIDLQTIAGNNIDIEVPDGELFFVGDNRVNSLDSRSFGTIPADSVVGRLIFRMTPLNNAQRF